MKIKTCLQLTRRKWLNLFEVRYVAGRGMEKTWHFASRLKTPRCVSGHFEKPDAVIIIAFHEGRRRLVVTREYRVPLADYEYGFPAGLLDAGETVQQAARRELKEETGLHLTRFLKTSPVLYSSAGMTDESVVLVFAQCQGAPSTAENEAAEDIEILLVSQAEAARLCCDANLKFDARAWPVLARFGTGGWL